MMTKALSPFSARALVENWHEIPKVLIGAWKRTMHQDVLVEVALCVDNEESRNRKGRFALAGALTFATIAVVAWMNSGPGPDVYYGVAVVAAVCTIACSFIAGDQLIDSGDRSLAFDLYHTGFGNNLRELCTFLGITRDKLKSTNLMEAATAVLDAKAREFVTVEHSLRIGLGRRLKRQDWKFDPAWNKAREAFSAAYDVFERFELVESVEKKGDEWKSYITRAEAKLASEEDSLGP